MRQLGRKKSDLNHLLRNLATSLVLYEVIETTEPKAKEIKSFLDKIIARAKKADLNAIRRLDAVLFDKNAVKKVIEVLVPRYEGRTSGFIKSYHLKNRLGDNSKMIRLELVDRKVFAPEAKAEKVEKIKETKTETKSISKAKSNGSK